MQWITRIAIAVCLTSSAVAADLPIAGASTAPVASGVEVEPNSAMATYTACSTAIAQWAEPYAPLSIETVMAGPTENHLSGTRVARLFVRIVYNREGGPETRKDTIECTVGEDGTTVAVVDR